MRRPVKTAVINGRKVQYTSKTKFLVQTGKDRKSGYKTVKTVVGDPHQALIEFGLVSGFKKRLCDERSGTPLVKG